MGTLDGSIDNINRATMANTTLTAQINERLGVAGNNMRNPDDDGRTDKAKGCALACPGGIFAHMDGNLTGSWGINMEGLGGIGGLARG
ncbi:hypothetical protein GUJ93_ZPchr0013g34260 [Zizania palustris]|uniref:Uncharacterized protein n=1 Tax=Zizania palustris TaxID=103762 RepID=A0A8J6C2T7_ZIZPA|nr:hypothetical protein GUJ93_ZPchr0013g34260 [Zizania palustris]